MRLAYADPPYPGKAHLYPENTEVDHAALVETLCGYDGWALSTDEVNLRDVLNLCPPKTRVLAWCRSNTPPFQPYPYAAWEPVLCWPGRSVDVLPTRSYVETAAALGASQRDGITGQKTKGFCEWVIRCLGASPGDTLDDLFPGTGIMGDTFAAFSSQLTIPQFTKKSRGHKVDGNRLARVADPLPGFDRRPVMNERRLAS